jgi:hypothetical protein
MVSTAGVSFKSLSDADDLELFALSFSWDFKFKK